MIAKPLRVYLFAFILSAISVLSYESRIYADLCRSLAANGSTSGADVKGGRGVPAAKAFSLPLTFVPAVSSIGGISSASGPSSGTQFVGYGHNIAVVLTQDGIGLSTRSHSASAHELALLRFIVRGRKVRGLKWNGERKLRGESNYFVGNDPKSWRTHVPHFERVVTQFKGIGVEVYGNETGLEFDLHISPAVDLSRLRLDVQGSHNTHGDLNGDLVMSVGGTEFRMKRPTVYDIPPAGREVQQNLAVGPTKELADADLAAPIRSAVGSSVEQQGDRSHRASRPRGDKVHRRSRPRTTARPHRDRPRNRDVPSERRHRRSPATHEGTRNNGKTSRSFQPRAVDASYAIAGDGTIGFRVVGHDPHASLVIDPSISIAYSTFLGGTGIETATGVAVDATGNVYVGGTTTSAATFSEAASKLGPGLGTTVNDATDQPEEFFVAKIDPRQSGANSLVYLTFVGGSANQAGGLIAVDANGGVALTGTTTSADFPVTDGSTLKSGTNSTVVAKLDSSGSQLVYSTIFGGNGSESIQSFGGVAIDKSGNIFVASETSSSNLPVTSGAYASTYQSTSTDGFLAIFQPSGTPHLKYCSYLGLNALVGIGGIALDASGNAYVAGFISGPLASFPSKNAFQGVYGGGSFDAFVMKISPSGNGAADLVYASLLGGGQSDQAFAIAVDSATPPNAYVTGTTSSSNFPTHGAVTAYQATLPYYATAQTSNAFLTVIAQNASTGQTSLAYSTYLGGSQVDAGNGVVALQPWAVYVTGTAKSWDFPWHDNFQPFNGDGDAFLAKLDTTSGGTASLIYSTPLGGTAAPGTTAGTQGSAIAVDASGGVPLVWIAGQTNSADFPSAGNPGNGFQAVCASCQQSPGQSDAFIVEVHESSAQLASLYFGAPGIPLNFGKQPVGSINIPPQFAAIKNSGEAALEISSIGIIGLNAADFSLSSASGCAPATISPGGMCSFEVGFTPSITGPEGAFVAVTSNAPGSPQVLQVIGTGLGLAAAPTSLTFTNQIAGTVSAPQNITLANTTNDQVYLDGIAIAGASSADFQPTKTAGMCVASAAGMNAGATCLISVTFSPTASGNASAEVDVQYHVQGLAEQELVIPLSGIGTAPAPVASVQPATMNFGTIAVRTKTSAQTATLTNTGSAALNLTSVTIAGTNAADFAIVASGDSPCPAASGSIALGASCTIGVQFAPQTSGTKSAALSFADNAGGSPQTIVLTGAAQSPATVQVSPSTLTFPAQSVGTKSPAQQITISDTSTNLLAINGISITGTNAAEFTETNNCPSAVGPSANCVVSVIFQPTATGTRTASVTISDDAADSPQTVVLTGTATAPVVAFSPASIDFGSQAVATTSAPVTITVSNTGTGALVIGAISLTGSNAADFVETDTCSGSAAPNGIAAGGSCTIKVTFTPTCSNASSARIAALSIVDNAAGSPQSIGLSGAGTGSFCFVASAGGLTATISAGQTATYALQVGAANGFSGSIGFACAGAPSAATCGVTPANVTVGGSALGNVTVSVATTAPGSAIMWPVPSMPFVAMLIAAFSIAISSGGRVLPCRKLVLRRRSSRTRRLVQLAACIYVIAVCVVACGGGSGATPPPPTDPGTPVGSYSLTLTGTPNGGSPQSIALALRVQ